MTIAIFEDNRAHAAKLEQIIRKHTQYPSAINTGEAQGMIAFAKRSPGAMLYLLDIVKEERTDGFRIAEEITALDDGSLIVFLTDYPEKIQYNAYFKTKAFTCIYKENPSLERELWETIRLAEQALSGKCLLIHAGRFETLYLPYEDIFFLEAVKGTGKLCIHSQNGRYIIRATLREMEKTLASHGFVRCHRSVLLNTRQEMRMDSSSKTIFFPGGASCPYSAARGGRTK